VSVVEVNNKLKAAVKSLLKCDGEWFSHEKYCHLANMYEVKDLLSQRPYTRISADCPAIDFNGLLMLELSIVFFA